VALIVLDASVVIAHLDPDDAHHSAVVAALEQHADDDLRLPASAYAEALVGPARTGTFDAARESMQALLLGVEPITQSLAERAAVLRATDRSLRLPDALVLGCADTLNAAAVLTTDRRWGRFSRVRVIA
jgi:predicted nucleic acid-binding protein